MKLFWQVDIDKYNIFVDYISNKYNNGIWTRELENQLMLRYNNNIKYLYFCVEHDYNYSYSINHYYMFTAYYSNNNKEWLINNNYKYMGIFNDRKDKLIKLDKLSKK